MAKLEQTFSETYDRSVQAINVNKELDKTASKSTESANSRQEAAYMSKQGLNRNCNQEYVTNNVFLPDIGDEFFVINHVVSCTAEYTKGPTLNVPG